MPIGDSEIVSLIVNLQLSKFRSKKIVSLIMNPQFLESKLGIWTSYDFFCGQPSVVHQVDNFSNFLEIWKFEEVRSFDTSHLQVSR